MEHIIAEKHGGTTFLENLALACPYCNRAKGTDLGSIDPKTNQLRDAQENKVPIAIFPTGALLRECTLRCSRFRYFN
jgi:5-methylcytosine-specific restriction endonuclease McrA